MANDRPNATNGTGFKGSRYRKRILASLALWTILALAIAPIHYPKLSIPLGNSVTLQADHLGDHLTVEWVHQYRLLPTDRTRYEFPVANLEQRHFPLGLHTKWDMVIFDRMSNGTVGVAQTHSAWSVNLSLPFLAAFIWLLYNVSHSRRSRPPELPLVCTCRQCGYDLRAHDQPGVKCPECGAVVKTRSEM